MRRVGRSVRRTRLGGSRIGMVVGVGMALRAGERKDLGADDGGGTMHLAEVRQG